MNVITANKLHHMKALLQEQQRWRTQTDQFHCCSLLSDIIKLYNIQSLILILEILSLKLDCIAVQANMSLTLARFSHIEAPTIYLKFADNVLLTEISCTQTKWITYKQHNIS